MILFFRNFSHVHSMISSRNLLQIQWFFIPWIRLRVLFPKISNFLISIHISLSDLIKFKEIIKINLIPYGFDPYSPLYPSIRIYFLKLVSLILILTLKRVFSMTSRSQFVTLWSQSKCLHTPNLKAQKHLDAWYLNHGLSRKGQLSDFICFAFKSLILKLFSKYNLT